jgi:hypothetical protein
LVMGFRNLELLSINWILYLQVDFMLEILGESQIIFVNAERVLVFAQNVQVPLMELLWNLKVAPPFDFILAR